MDRSRLSYPLIGCLAALVSGRAAEPAPEFPDPREIPLPPIVGPLGRLPGPAAFDQHWFLALCAPRPFLALEGDTDTISLPEAVRQSFVGAKPAYALFGAEERLGANYARHGHAFTAEDWTAMMDFFDHHLRGMKTNRRFDRFPTEAELDAALATARAAQK